MVPISVRLFIFLSVFLISHISAGQSFSFRKINSGTKADIQSIKQDNNQRLYLLTDKIFHLKNDVWEKMDFPAEGKIYTFCPLSEQDIWFTTIPFTSTCVLYHYHDGITENIRTPFSNYITSIHFISENLALFAGVADVAVYENGSFQMLPPSPVLSNIVKIYGSDVTSFWIKSATGEVFFFERGAYKPIVEGKAVMDFCFASNRDGFLLAGDELYRVTPSGVNLCMKDSALRKARKMVLLESGQILMVGENGYLLSYTDGRLQRYPPVCSEYLMDLVTIGANEIWICGKNGRLLYSGLKQFPEYNESNQGFSSQKLSSIGLSRDDEYGVAMTDFNGDGKIDLYTVRLYEQNRLYMNNLVSANMLPATNGFTDEVVKRNAMGVLNPEDNTELNELKLGLGVADLDNDGDQDVYLCYLNSFNRLLLNTGKGYFRNVSDKKNRACENMERSNAAAFADVDIDGDLDLFVTSENGSNRLFENDGTGHFRDITSTSGLSSTGGGMCASFADVNNDGLPDLCATFWYPSNKLYVNESVKGTIHFRDITHLTDLSKATPSKSNAVAFADVNNDGYIDLFIANRNTPNKLYLNDGKGLFFDKTKDYFQPENYLSNGAVFADFDLDGYQDLYVTNVGENVLYRNMNGQGFMDVTAAFGAELGGYCTGGAAGDVDNDGDPDLYVANYVNGNSNLFLNITEKNTFVKLKLQGIRSNRDAIGTKVWLYKLADGKQPGILAGYRELSGGGGYGSASAKEVIFGVEPGVKYYARVKFPSSPDTLIVDHILAGKTLTVSELTGLPALYTESKNNLLRFFLDQEKQPEIIKYTLIILLLFLYNLKLRKSIRNIVLFRSIGTLFIFILFVFINRFFLFQWFSVSYFIAPVIVLGLLALLHLFIDRILLQRLLQKEKLDLREKLSRDLHDDLASTLGSISIYAQTMNEMKESLPSHTNQLSGKIAGLTQSALQSISDIIWMTSPRNDTLQSLVSKISNYMFEILTDNNISFHSAVDISEEPVILQEKVRNDAFLILKEAFNNIVRHAAAKNVTFTATLAGNLCTLSLKDDGVGMERTEGMKKGSHGNGLTNMRQRALESKIEFHLLSVVGVGTEITLTFKI